MSKAPGVLTDAVRQTARRSVLCWLATVDAQGQPNVSPKEVWAMADDRHVVVANIASPVSVRNIAQQPQVCLSFMDVLVQKGFKLQGRARELLPGDADYAHWAAPLLAMAGERIPVRSVLLIAVDAVQPIVAPSYWLFPETTTEASQVEAARRSYGLREDTP
jgi:predicted pyridoxine 5'-phosphate oxidase superfamily flavin-nucleotide-binding protein